MKRTGIFLAVTFFLMSPILASAAGLVPCNGPDCGTDDAIRLANNVITYIIAMIGVIAVIALVITGFQLVTSAGKPGAWEAAKTRFTNIVIGIILILAAFLIVDTVLKGLTGHGLEETTGGLVK